MVRVTDDLALSQDEVGLYHTTDPLLANLPVLLFHGPSTTTNSTLNSSRIQVHAFTAAGFQSYPRITISPNSPFYQSVNHLPRDKQGDEICRGLAFGLLKYFRELPEVVKSGLILQCAKSRTKRPGSAPTLFGEQHAADLAASMVKVENIGDVIQDIEAALRPQNIHHVDIDLVLPPGSISPLLAQEGNDAEEDPEDEDYDSTLKQYGQYAPLVKLFGEVAFLPTSKLRRAPSKPTSLIRSKSFLKDQKMSLRREMGELVDTEERYVIKMHELVNHIADDYRDKAKKRSFGSFSPTDEDLKKLFPKCLDRILQVNSAFLADIRKVMDDTEEDAMQDLETLANSAGSRYGGSGRLKDPTGALAFAEVLLEWFPQFSNCYQEYIRSSQDFPQIITSFMRQPSSFSQRVQQTGEQRLRSAVIEPVQRLPRYSLFIDNIVNYLPIGHTALQPMLKARDIITSICSLDPPETDKSQIVSRLRSLIEAWPSSLHPQGRLITAIDFTELPPPFKVTVSPQSRDGMFLLFADCIVLLRKNGEGRSARGVMAEIERPSASVMMASVTAAAGGQKHVYDLTFAGWQVLGDTRFTTSDDGRIVWMTSINELRDVTGRNRTAPAPTLRTFLLQGAYDGKAFKLTEECTKARIEGRFSEKERETDQWCLRSVKLAAAGINIYTAVFAEGIDKLIEGRREPAPVRIVVDHIKGTKGAPVGHYGVEIVANVGTMAGGMNYRLEVDGLNDKVYVDEVVTEHVLPTFVKRAIDLIRAQHQPTNPALTTPLLSFHSKILNALRISSENDKAKYFRPASPVKMLSSFLNGGFSSSTASFSNSTSGNASPPKHQRTPLMGNIPMLNLAPTLSRNNSNRSTHSVQEVDARNSVRLGSERPENPLVRLEETFTGYIGALQSRKGNVVGKVLRSRGNADELAINALYNAFIENPLDTRAASEVSVDIIFVAFEKYLRMAWKDQMGQVMPLHTLNLLQEKALKMHAIDFADFVKSVFGEMAPQNRRAFIAIVKLLADLLEGCGNDGDRGAVTAAFAELLVVDGNPHDYINLLDRVVEDSDRLFEDIGLGAVQGVNGSLSSRHGSVNAKSNTSANGSLTSNTSSLRRRFDSLLRQNSNREPDNRGLVWRTLSKTNRSVATGEMVPSSLSRGSRRRSQSIESPNRRSSSRDRPTVIGAFDDRPSSSNGQPSRLSTVAASPPMTQKEVAKTLRKKRRSSLSDLRGMMAAATLGASSPLTPSPERTKPSSPPRTPSPSKLPVAGGIMDRSRSQIFRTGSPIQKENMPIGSASRNIGNLTERPQNITSPSDGKGHAEGMSTSNIPSLRRDRAPSSSKPPTSSSKIPQKLRLQSPQKLRERLQNEAKAINEAETSLQNELSKIGEEMAKLNTGSSSFRTQDLDKLSITMRSLESKIPEIVKDLTARNDKIKEDLEKSLQASEFKVKALDQLYKESSAENELLYEKFNGELGKIVRALKAKGKDSQEEMIVRMRESTEETAKAMKEAARLKREILTLRTLLKGNE